jgi:hypothetical protein
LAQIAPLPDDAEVQRLRELSMDYIREAERIENDGVTRVESSEQISAGLDAIARYFFARAVRKEQQRLVPYFVATRVTFADGDELLITPHIFMVYVTWHCVLWPGTERRWSKAAVIRNLCLPRQKVAEGQGGQ